MPNNPLTSKESWESLQSRAQGVQDVDLRDLFANDSMRFDKFSLSLDGFLLDYSKNHIDHETRNLLLRLAEESDITDWQKKFFEGFPINTTEERSALHPALRATHCDAEINSEHVGDFVQDVLARMQKFSNAIRSGDYRGHTGEVITDIVNIGIGGSDLGPHMVCEALKPFASRDIRTHFVSNVDARHLLSVLADLKAENTLFVIASKTFTTQETMTNAHSAKEWLVSELDGQAVPKHFVAVSSNKEAVESFGIEAQNTFPLRPWVGGRYSLWSAIGLPICLSLGYDNFYKLLRGAQAMDEHFTNAPLADNIPVMMALVGIWNWNFRGCCAQAILPYSYDLRLLPPCIQQLDMESNGKSVTRDGISCDYTTSPVVFGDQGSNGQHAFYQAIHQGTQTIPCDFIGVIQPEHGYDDHHRKLLANMIGQSQALMEGRPNTAEPHRYFAGNKPSTTILLERLDPYHLGMLVSAYEHKVFVQGIIWDINSFDQWGVELGKELTNSILSADDQVQFDSSTLGLLSRIQNYSRS